MFWCSRCKTERPLADFPPSRVTRPQWCRACLREDKCGPPVTRDCDWCGATMQVTTRRAAEARVFCSRPCKDKYRGEHAKAIRRAAKPERRCLHCAAVMAAATRSDAAYCSERCNTAAHNATRKASWKIGDRQERVSRAYIIERDGSRCHACGKRCKPEEIHLDHLVPLARGGSHAPENIRVACASCNLSRRAEGESQLLLIG